MIAGSTDENRRSRFARRWELLAFLLLLAAPSLATSQPPAPSAAAFAAQQAAYNQWLGRLAVIEAPVHRAIAEASAHLPTSAQGQDPARIAAGFRPLVEQLIQRTMEADAGLESLDLPSPIPDFLPSELQPATLKAQVHRLNLQVRTSFQSYLTLLDAAARHDVTALRRMIGPVTASMRTIIEFQVLALRGQQAAVPHESAAWNLVTVELLYNQVALRIADAFQPSALSISTAGLSRDLLALATSLDEAAAQGDSRIDAEIAMMRSENAMVRRRTDPSIEMLAQRQIGLLTSARVLFPMGHELAAHLRREAASIGIGPLSVAAWLELSRSIYPFRDRIVALEQAMTAGH